MLIIYALAALLAVALITLAVVKARSHSARQASQPAADASGPPAQAAPSMARGDHPEAGAWSLDTDMEATRIHRRTPHAADPAARQERDGAAPAAASARLVGLSGSQKDVSFPVSADGIIIGRSAACNVVLADHRVSSHHAWIGTVNGKFVLRDLDSTNGTFLNTQTESSVGEVELRAGDTILFGSHQGDQFRFLVD